MEEHKKQAGCEDDPHDVIGKEEEEGKDSDSRKKEVLEFSCPEHIMVLANGALSLTPVSNVSSSLIP